MSASDNCMRYPYNGSWERFAKDVQEHVLEVVLDTETHKHLRFRKPGTRMYWFDIVTWPGVLVVRGDMETFVLARERDMFAWIKLSGGINPGYWAEKVVAGDVYDRTAVEEGDGDGDWAEPENPDYRWQWIWCCWALAWGIDKYRAQQGESNMPGHQGDQ